MKREAILWSCVALLVFGALSDAEDQRPYLGVILDAAPLPELLTKHLQLEPEQGLRIANIMTGGPADKAGLERDDLIVALEGAKVVSQERFVDAVRGAGVGTEVKLEVIHLGRRQAIRVTLEPAPKEDEVSWKYPPEPPSPAPWRPGRAFRIGPDGRELLEVPFDKVPDLGRSFRRFFKESYTYHDVANGESYTIRIEGDPTDQDSELVLQIGDKKYPATVGSIESLPEKYREPARQAVADACSHAQKDGHVRRFAWPESRREFLESLPRPDLPRLLEQKDAALKKLQEQVERLQQRVEQMEKRSREMLDQRLRKGARKPSDKAEPPASVSESDGKAPI